MSTRVGRRAGSAEDVAPTGNHGEGLGEGQGIAATAFTEGVEDKPPLSPAELRRDFGAHFEAEYQRLVAQLYAITLDPSEAHDVVQDAYSRAWRNWAVIGSSPDPTGWIRRVAVGSTIHSWKRVLARFGVARPRPIGEGADARTGAVLTALGRLRPPERRAVVLFHMAGVSPVEIGALERVSPGAVQARLARARSVVTDELAEVLPALLDPAADEGYDLEAYPGQEYGGDGYEADGYRADAYDAGYDGSDRGVPDRSVPDRSVPDRGVPDRGVPDGSVPDGKFPDGREEFR